MSKEHPPQAAKSQHRTLFCSLPQLVLLFFTVTFFAKIHSYRTAKKCAGKKLPPHYLT